MHNDSTPTDHDLKFHSQTPGGLAKMTHWWVCSCGWESDRGIGHDGFRHAEAAADGHAAQYGLSVQRSSVSDEDFNATLGKLYGTIFLDGLKLPYEIFKHLTHDEFQLGIRTFFSVGADRHTRAELLQSVMEQIVRERMTEPERRRAAKWTARHWPPPDDPDTTDATPSPSPKAGRTPRLKPSRIAAFEAQWQAEHAADGAES